MTRFTSAARGWARSVIDSKAPSLAGAYRSFRDELRTARMQPKRTPFGFSLLGDPSMQDGTFERDETALIGELLQRADRLVDVDANVGYYTCLARAGGKPVVAFEPVSTNLRLLTRNLGTNGWMDVDLWPVGLSDTAGLLPIYGAATGASMVAGWSGVSRSYRQIIPVTTLDTVIAGRFAGEKLLVKIDVEGAEYGVLRGALETIEREPKPVWLVEITLRQHRPEVNRHFLDSFDLFLDRGYEVRVGASGRRKVTRAELAAWAADPNATLPTYNWLFTAPEVA